MHIHGHVPGVIVAEDLQGIMPLSLSASRQRVQLGSLHFCHLQISFNQPFLTHLLLTGARRGPAGLPGAGGGLLGEHMAQRGKTGGLSLMGSVLGTSKAVAPPAPSIGDAGHAQAQASGVRRELQTAHLANVSLAWPVSLELTRPRSHRWPVATWLRSSSPGSQRGLSGGARPPRGRSDQRPWRLFAQSNQRLRQPAGGRATPYPLLEGARSQDQAAQSRQAVAKRSGKIFSADAGAEQLQTTQRFVVSTLKRLGRHYVH